MLFEFGATIIIQTKLIDKKNCLKNQFGGVPGHLKYNPLYPLQSEYKSDQYASV